MAVTGYWYTKGMAHLLADMNWTADSASIQVALMGTGWTIATNVGQTSKEFWSDVSAFEIAAGAAPTAYTAKGKNVGATTYTVTLDSGKTVAVKPTSATNVVWTTPTFSTYGACIFKDSGVAATSPLIAYLDFGGVQSPSAGDFTITWNTDGIGKVTVS